MKLKMLFPWLCVLALLGGVLFLFSSNRQKNEELKQLREGSEQLQSLRAEVEQLKTTGSPAQNEEITRLRKDNQELLRLRNEVRQMRDDKKQLTQQAQTAQAQAERAQAQAQAVQSQAQQAAQALAAQQQALAARSNASPTAEQLANACINNLRQLDGAMQQWALENKKDANAVPSAKDLAAFLKDGIPKCPAGGTYTLKSVGTVPTCTIPGHALPQ